MSLHVHRNSFNAGEISPLMDARVDDAKYPFSCRILENFIPKIYGGAFRRPGTLFLGKDRLVSTWVELSTDLNHDLGIFGGGVNAAPSSTAGFEIGAIYLRNVRTVYKCTNGAAGTWALVSELSSLYLDRHPTVDDDTTFSFVSGSVIFNWYLGAIWTCSSNTNGAAVWNLVTAKTNVSATAIPTTSNDSDEGYETGSYWIRNVYTVSRLGAGPSWGAVSGAHKPISDRKPIPSDDTDAGFADGSIWIDNREGRVYELTEEEVSKQVRLIDFNVSATVRYQLEFGGGYVRIWSDAGTLLDDGSNPIVLSTPYAETELFEIQIAQLGNLAYLTHPSHPPQKLTRFFVGSAAFFQWSEVDWKYPCFRDWNTTAITATPSATSGNTKKITLNAQPLVEVANYYEYIGARVALSQRRVASHVKRALSSTGQSSEISILGEYQLYTYGVFVGTIRIQAKDSSGAWNTLKSFEFTSGDNRQIVYSSITTEVTQLRLDITRTSDTNGVAYLEAGDSRRVGYGEIRLMETTVSGNDPITILNVDIESDFDSTSATTQWALEAWAPYSGYPRAVCFHEQRLWFGGTEAEPNTFWASAVNDFENFRRGAFDSDALAFTLAAQEGSAIQSMVSHEALVIFTQSEEWTAMTSENTAITPSNIFVRRQSRFGSAHRQAFVAANNLLFLQRGSRKLRQFTYSGGAGGQGQASDLTVLAEHITDGGIRQMAFQQQPDPIIWAVTNDGVLLSLTYEADQNVIAWARHTSGTGLFESVSTIYGGDSGADEVWVSVKRGSVRHIERIDPQAYSKLEAGDSERMIYLDSAIIVENDTATDAIEGLNHLEGEDVGILADGAVQAAREVESGEIVLDGDASIVVAGLPYASKLQPSKFEIPGDNGTSQGKTFVCKKVTLNLWKSGELQYADNPNEPDESKWFNAIGRSTSTAFGEPEPLFTGFKDLTNLGSHKDSVDFCVRETLPLPCNVLAMIPQIHISKD
jgi:hypothetical protein